MSATIHPIRPGTVGLVEGEHLDQPEFHRRYEAMPRGCRAELIDGVVYMPTPLSDDHRQFHFSIIFWLGHYVAQTEGVKGLDNATAILGRRNEPQPDVSLCILPEFGGQTRVQDGYVHGAPELIVEIAKASRYIDLGPKLVEYQRAAVQEYIVRALDPDELIWFRLNEGTLKKVSPDEDGIYRSIAFPGLWLDAQALLASDNRQMRRVIELGLASPEHADFVARLAANRSARP